MLCFTCCWPSGDHAEIGKINKLVSQVENMKTNLMLQMEILGRWLATIVVLIAVGAFLLALLYAREPFVQAFESAVAIAGGWTHYKPWGLVTWARFYAHTHSSPMATAPRTHNHAGTC